MKIGVFDSGIGGKSVAAAIARAYPEADVIFRDDRAHMPYGTKLPAEVLGYVVPILESLVDESVDCIVIACNTVSTTLIGELRQRFSLPLVALEPMVKPAAEQTKSGVIAVCATRATLHSTRYATLKQQYAEGITVLEPDCSDWAYLIEHSQMNEAKIRQDIEPAVAAGADVIVLGCTHYHWIEEEIKAIIAGRAMVLQPETAIVRRLATVLPQVA